MVVPGVAALTAVLAQMYLVIPLFGALADVPGAPPGGGAQTVTAFALPYALGFLVLGPLADRYGPRRLILASVSVVTAGAVVAALAPTWDVLLGARMIQGFAAAPFTPAILLAVSTRLAPDRRLVATSSIISAGMAAAVVGQVAAQLGLGPLGLRGVLWAAAAALAVCLIALRLLLPADDRRPSTGSVVDAYRAMLGLLRRPTLILLLVAALTYLTVFVGAYAALALIGPRIGMSGSTEMLLVRASALPAIAAVPLVSPRLGRIPARTRLTAALGAAAAASSILVILGFAGLLSAGAFVAAMFVVAGAVAVAAPATVTLVMQSAPDSAGAANALYSAAIFGGASVGTPLAAAITSVDAEAQSAFGVFALVCVGCVTVALACTRFVTRPGR